MDITNLLNFALLILGFGFVIFWHELGHFLAAKVTGVKVEQFAVGFGQALLCYRKGLGVTVGTSAKQYEERAKAALADSGGDPVTADAKQIDDAAARIGLSATEYRLNWLPLGGYVKMLGQDDLDPNSTSADPRSYNKATVPKRMLIISAGVIMNIILAGILFGVLFTIGFNSPPAVVGAIQPNSAAQRAGVQVGDELVSFDGDVLHDFTKISLAVPLADEGDEVPLVVMRDGKRLTLPITPLPEPSMHDALTLGVRPTAILVGPDVDDVSGPVGKNERIIAVDGKPVGPEDFAVLDAALQASDGSVPVTIRTADGTERSDVITGTFAAPFASENLAEFAGMVPRVAVFSQAYAENQAVELEQGDVIVSMRRSGGSDVLTDPDFQQLREFLAAAGGEGKTISVTLLRNGEVVELTDVTPVKVARFQYGLGFTPTVETGQPVVASVIEGSIADTAGIQPGMTLATVNGAEVSTWFDVDKALKAAQQGQPLTFTDAAGNAYETTPSAEQLAAAGGNRLEPVATLQALERPRQADNVGQALWWGVTETKDMVIKFYLTLRQIFRGGLSPRNLQGPVGILHTGTILSGKGTDWMIWFLAVISANLAVVNFLPLPILDGGHMAFLLWEGATGKKPSEKVHVITQFAGLALIAALFLFVTFNDIIRLVVGM